MVEDLFQPIGGVPNSRFSSLFARASLFRRGFCLLMRAGADKRLAFLKVGAKLRFQAFLPLTAAIGFLGGLIRHFQRSAVACNQI